MPSQSPEFHPERSRGRDAPESPFLAGQLFAEETSATRAEQLQVDSPFQNTLEPGRSETIEPSIGEGTYESAYVHGDRVVEPELEEEACWQSGEAQERPYLDETGLGLEFNQEKDELEEIRADEEEESRAVDEILSGLDRPVSQNRRYSEELGWRVQYDTIARFLGFIDYTPDEKTFAEAIARWQRS
jgi:hypothetical protein